MFLLLFTLLTSVFAENQAPFDVRLDPISSIGGRPCCTLATPNAYGRIIAKTMHTEYVGIDKLGTYSFSNRLRKEHLGILYSCRGGFIDLAHYRHVFDWSVYIYQEILALTENNLVIQLPYEGGKRKITFDKSILQSSNVDKILTAARVSYDLSVWHEILTWYVPSTFLIKEKVSSFSPEDLYSNLLGAQSAVEVLVSLFPDENIQTHTVEEFEKLANENMLRTLTELEALEAEKSIKAFDLIKNVWWNAHYSVPRRKGTLKRSTQAYGFLLPHESPHAAELGCVNFNPKGLYLPYSLQKDFYKLEIEKDSRITASKKTIVTTDDFDAMTKTIEVNMVNNIGKDVFKY